ncbi:MAG: universal stress protein [Caldilineaceae bacterium]
MYKRILVPLDGSDLAEKALAYLPCFSDKEQTQIVLLGVLDTMRYATVSLGYVPMNLNELSRNYETYLQDVVQRLNGQGYQVTTKLVEGDAAESILEMAKTSLADLIVMATHGRSGVLRWTMGSVAERVLQEAHLPVLLVRAKTEAHGQLKRILVTLDGSALAEKSLTNAEKLAKDTGADLVLFQAVAPLATDYSFARVPAQLQFDQINEQLFANADAYLKGVALRFHTEGVTCDTMVLRGDPASLICDVVNESNIDLVVISTHGRTGFNRWVYGSVTSQVIRGVNCPVLVIPNTMPEAVQAPVPRSENVLVAA